MSRQTSSNSSRTSSHGKLKPITEGKELLNTTTPSPDSGSNSTFRTSSQEAFPIYNEPSIDTLLSYDVEVSKQRSAELAGAVARARAMSVPVPMSVDGGIKKKTEEPPLPPQESLTNRSSASSSPSPPPKPSHLPRNQQQLVADIAALQNYRHDLQARLDTLNSRLLAKEDSEKGLLALMRGQTQSLEEVFARLEGRGVDLKRPRSESDMSGGKPLWDERVWCGRRVANWALLPSVELRGMNEEGG
ncbi:hypothetical protein LTR86_009588 [Recurvomyces mirabilis]|nr:hypothetical protein LTR86_009588 [Recurvomyces mirabilis]